MPIRSRLLILVVAAVIVSAALLVVSAACFSDNGVLQGAANVLVLGVTAVVVVFYTDETRRMASSTEDMAKATGQALEENRRLAESTELMAAATKEMLEQDRALRKCELDLSQQATHIFRLKNLGPGRARVLSFASHTETETRDHPDIPLVLEPGECADLSQIPDDTVKASFTALDDLGRETNGETERHA